MENEFIEFLNNLKLDKNDIDIIKNTKLSKIKIKVANFLLKINKAGFCTFLIYSNKNNYSQVILKYVLYYMYKNKYKYIKKMGEENYIKQIDTCLYFALENKIKEQKIGLSNYFIARNLIDLNILCCDFFIFQNMYSKNYINFSNNRYVKKGDKISKIDFSSIENFSYKKAKKYILNHSKKFKNIKAYIISIPFSYVVLNNLKQNNEYKKFLNVFSFLSSSNYFPINFSENKNNHSYLEILEYLNKNPKYTKYLDTVIISKKDLKKI